MMSVSESFRRLSSAVRARPACSSREAKSVATLSSSSSDIWAYVSAYPMMSSYPPRTEQRKHLRTSPTSKPQGIRLYREGLDDLYRLSSFPSPPAESNESLRPE